MEDLSEFQFKEVLNFSQSERTLYLLGTIKNKQGSAIAILSPRLHDPANLLFQNIETVFTNDIYCRFKVELNTQFDIQFIYPITEKHKKKYERKTYLIEKESGEDYEKRKDAMLNQELAHIQWVTNILQGKTEVQRVLFRCDEFVICQDFKWADIKDIDSMHLTIIFSDPKLHSIRDLRGHHVPRLERTERCLEQTLKQKIGVSLSRCRVYFHYPPTFYRLHIHVMNLSLESLSCRVERCHDFWLVVQNLKMNGDYYKNITLNKFVEQ